MQAFSGSFGHPESIELVKPNIVNDGNGQCIHGELGSHERCSLAFKKDVKIHDCGSVQNYPQKDVFVRGSGLEHIDLLNFLSEVSSAQIHREIAKTAIDPLEDSLKVSPSGHHQRSREERL